MTLGNPAPFGLLCFGMTTAFLMYVEVGWCEPEFEISIVGTGTILVLPLLRSSPRSLLPHTH
jgi:succinate-acetate transporter protein